jgi:putative ABC transport system permease protein
MAFPRENPVGQRLRLEAVGQVPATEWLTIVGVVGNIRQNNQEGGEFDPIVYLPFAAAPIQSATIVTRSTASTGTVGALVRQRVDELDRDLPVQTTVALDTLIDRGLSEGRLLGGLLGVFAAIAVILAAVGLYGVTAMMVTQRTREIGVRMAIGAQSWQILMLVTRQVSRQLLFGLVAGTLGAAVVARVLERALAQVRSTDVPTMGAVVTFLVLIAVAGCAIPARRAARLDPVVALRAE